jgi:hypothetical protein
MIKRTTAFAATLLLVSGSSLAAQDAASHSGFWLGGGLGVGLTDEDSAGDDAGPAAYLRMGGTPSDRVLLGGEVIGLSRDVGDATVSQANTTFSVLYYPASPGGFFAKGGIGFASAIVSTDVAGGTFTSDESGFGLTFGAGYDVRIGGNLYLTPNLDILVQTFDDFADSNLFLFSLGIGFH